MCMCYWDLGQQWAYKAGRLCWHAPSNIVHRMYCVLLLTRCFFVVNGAYSQALSMSMYMVLLGGWLRSARTTQTAHLCAIVPRPFEVWPFIALSIVCPSCCSKQLVNPDLCNNRQTLPLPSPFLLPLPLPRSSQRKLQMYLNYQSVFSLFTSTCTWPA